MNILSSYVRNSHEEPFVLPEDISREERKIYPIQLLEEKIEKEFKNEMKKRILPRLRHTDNAHAKVRFKMKTTMKNTEGESRNREIHTRPIEINLSIARERNQIFEEVKQEWVNVQNIFFIHATGERAPEQWFRAIHHNVLNPEIEMNQEDFVSGNSSDYWFLYSIDSFELEI